MRISALAVCFCLVLASAAQDLQRFTGNWRVDEQKSEEKSAAVTNPPAEAPQIPPPPPAHHKYTLEKVLLVGQILKISGGEAGTTAVYTIDPNGKEVSDPIPDAPGSVRIAKSHWNDGKLVTEWQLRRNGEAFMHGTDTRSLTTDGLQIVDRLIESPRHHAEVHLVLNRVR
jgi:hypothetical protein